MTFALAAAIILLSFASESSSEFEKLLEHGCNYKTTTSKLQADFIISAVFPFNIKKTNKNEYSLLGHSVLWAETVLYGIKLINSNPSLLPGVIIGYDIYETCSSDLDLIISHSLDFTMDTKYWPSMETNVGELYTNSSTEEKCTCDNASQSKLIAIIGAATDDASEIMAKLLNMNKLTLISYAASSSTLNNNSNFLRTIPSNVELLEVIISLVKHYKWRYVSAIAYDNEKGRSDLLSLSESLKTLNTCLAMEFLFETKGKENEIVRKLTRLQGQSEVVILWSEREYGEPILEAAKNLKLVWVLTWKEDTYVNKHPNLEGSFTITLAQKKLTSFDDYLRNLKYDDVINPWLKEMWDIVDPYRFFFTPSIIGQHNTRNVIATVYAIAHGLHKTLHCNETVCLNKSTAIDHNILYKNINNSAFIVQDQIFNMSNQLQDKAYNIKQIQINERVSKDRNETFYMFQKVGSSDGNTKMFTINNSLIKWKNKFAPVSQCNRNCIKGERLIQGSSTCCWECVKCDFNQISTAINQDYCVKCSNTEITNLNSSRCLRMKNINMKLFTTDGEKTLFILTMIGIISTLAVFIIFLKNWDSPIVKSSNREMSIIQLIAILALFCIVVFYYIELTITVCISQNLYFGVVYSTIISFIVVKTYRLVCVFQEHRLTKVSKYLQNKYQMFLTLIPVLILTIYTLLWYQVYEIEIGVERFPSQVQYMNYCKVKETTYSGDIENHIILYGVIALLFFLSLFTGFMAFRARRLPQNFNEAQYICYAMFTSCLIWLLFIVIYISQKQDTKPLAFLLVNAINTQCLLLILYAYKIVIIIFYPHLNTKAHFQKLAKNATVATFIQELEPGSKQRPSKVSVISFNFDNMFDEYKKNLEKPTTPSPVKKKHFPSKVLARLSTIRRSKKPKVNKRLKKQQTLPETLNDIQNLETEFIRSSSLDLQSSRQITRQKDVHVVNNAEIQPVNEISNVQINKQAKDSNETSEINMENGYRGKDSLVSTNSLSFLLNNKMKKQYSIDTKPNDEVNMKENTFDHKYIEAEI